MPVVVRGLDAVDDRASFDRETPAIRFDRIVRVGVRSPGVRVGVRAGCGVSSLAGVYGK